LNTLGPDHIVPTNLPIERHHTGKRMSDIVVFMPAGERVAWLAGQVAADPAADITGQTRSVLAQIDTLLAEIGSDKTQILSATIYLSDIKDFPLMNAVWDAWVPQGHTPARATVEANLAAPAYKIEIQVVAAAPAAS
jgi:enamine deaminase RidA (YjgF/YER057c/UK114 family)